MFSFLTFLIKLFYVIYLIGLPYIDAPEIVSAPSPQQVVEGNGVILFCNATGYPPPTIAWTKQGSNTVLSTSETLQLTNLMSGDNGALYICKVENIIGSREANSAITVLCEY